MSLANRQKPYKALTHVHLPFIEKRHAPGDLIEISDLQEAQQTDEDVEKLLADGAIGEENDEIHPQNIIPDPNIPTVQSVVAQAQSLMAEMKDRGEKIPKELRAVAELNYHVHTADSGRATDENA